MSRMSDNLNYDRNGKNFENEDIHLSSKIPGNTVDYYNDDMSRNVVQGLFSGAEKKDKGVLVSGYKDEDDFEEPISRKKMKPLEPFASERPSSVFPERTKARRDEEERDVYGDIYTRERQSRDSHVRHDEMRDSSTRDIRARDTEREISRAAKKETEEIDYSRYRSRDRFGERSPQEPSAKKSRGITPAISIEDRQRRTPTPPTTSKKGTYRAGAAQENDFNEVLPYHEESMSFMKIIAISAAVVVLIILAALIFKINSTNNKLEQAMASLADYEASENDMNQLKMEKEALADNVRLLTEELEEYKAAVLNNTSEERPETEEPPTEATGAGASSTGNRSYTVKPGDNLSKISTEFYGTVKEVERIKEANGLQNNNLYVGQVLIIP